MYKKNFSESLLIFLTSGVFPPCPFAFFLLASALSKDWLGLGQFKKEKNTRTIRPLLAGTDQPRRRCDLFNRRRNICNKLSDNVSSIVIASEEVTGCAIGSVAGLHSATDLFGGLP